MPRSVAQIRSAGRAASGAVNVPATWFAPRPLSPLRPGWRRSTARLIIHRRWEPRVPRRRAIQPRQPLLQLGDPRCQHSILGRRNRGDLPLKGDQRVPRAIRRLDGHVPPSSGHPRSNQGGTLGRLAQPEPVPGHPPGSTPTARKPIHSLNTAGLNAYDPPADARHPGWWVGELMFELPARGESDLRASKIYLSRPGSS